MQKTGVYEWADESVNIQIGCENGCRYCYARHRAVERFGYCKSNEAWLKPVVDRKKVNKQYRKNFGTVMFPSTHDITPSNVHDYLQVATKLLEAGNNLLIVSKPDFECIKKLCFELSCFDKSRILFRFTIGSLSDEVLRFWEPNTPSPSERVKCLKYAFAKGYRTSVSCEPYLDAFPCITYGSCLPFLTDSFWIGKLRGWHRILLDDCVDEPAKKYLAQFKENLSDEFVKAMYQILNGRPLVKWKDSIREVVETQLK